MAANIETQKYYVFIQKEMNFFKRILMVYFGWMHFSNEWIRFDVLKNALKKL